MIAIRRGDSKYGIDASTLLRKVTCKIKTIKRQSEIKNLRMGKYHSGSLVSNESFKYQTKVINSKNY